MKVILFNLSVYKICPYPLVLVYFRIFFSHFLKKHLRDIFLHFFEKNFLMFSQSVEQLGVSKGCNKGGSHLLPNDLRVEALTINIKLCPGVNFTNVLHKAFTCADPKSAKIHWPFCAFGIYMCKNC